MSCRYPTVRLDTNDDASSHLQELQELDSRIKKVETHLNTRGANSQKQRTGYSATPPPLAKAVTHKARSEHPPRFHLKSTGLVIDTDIAEAHHFIKLLFNTIDPAKVHERAASVFRPVSLPCPESTLADDIETCPSLPELIQSQDPIDSGWVEMILRSRHYRCFLIYQPVGRVEHYTPTPPLDTLLRQKHYDDLLLALATRAYIYHHETELHQDTEFPIRTRKGQHYLQCAQELLENCYTSSSRTTVRALLHLFLYHVHASPHNAFKYCHLAVRMSLDLGLNKAPDAQEDDRRLWWSSYWCSLYAAVEYGLPIPVHELDCAHTSLPAKLPEETDDVGYCIDYCIASIQLLRIRYRIADTLKKKWTAAHSLLNEVSQLERDLDAWSSQLAKHIRLENETWQDPLCIELGLLLHVQMQSTRIQLYQCFLENPSVPVNLIAVRNCKTAAGSFISKLDRYSSALRMCTCIQLLPNIERCTATLKALSKCSVSDTDITADAYKFLSTLSAVLSTRSFSLIPVAADITTSIQNLLAENDSPSITRTTAPKQALLSSREQTYTPVAVPSWANYCGENSDWSTPQPTDVLSAASGEVSASSGQPENVYTASQHPGIVSLQPGPSSSTNMAGYTYSQAQLQPRPPEPEPKPRPLIQPHDTDPYLARFSMVASNDTSLQQSQSTETHTDPYLTRFPMVASSDTPLQQTLSTVAMAMTAQFPVAPVAPVVPGAPGAFVAGLSQFSAQDWQAPSENASQISHYSGNTSGYISPDVSESRNFASYRSNSTSSRSTDDKGQGSMVYLGQIASNSQSPQSLGSGYSSYNTGFSYGTGPVANNQASLMLQQWSSPSTPSHSRYEDPYSQNNLSATTQQSWFPTTYPPPPPPPQH